MFTKDLSSTERPLESALAPDGQIESTENGTEETLIQQQEKRLRRKVDLRLCTIASILGSLDLLDSGIISSASVTSMPRDLGLGGNRYAVAIFLFTVASVVCQLPSTLAVRLAGPRVWFTFITVCAGLVTLGTAFVQTWRQMVVLRVLLGMSTAGLYPGLTYLISTWYTRQEQQLRFAFVQSGQVVVLATGSIVNYGLDHLDGRAGLAGWRWMFLVQGLATATIGVVAYWWMVDFPEHARRSFHFLSADEASLATRRIQADRDDVEPEPFSWSAVLVPFLDPKVYGLCGLFFLLNLVSTSLSYFLPIILQSGMGFSTDQSILLSAPPYYYAVIPVLLTSLVGDTFRLRGPLITLNALCLIAGVLMLGLPASTHVAVRYVGTYLATGAYVSNWAALNAYQANNVVGQWKRAATAAAVTACTGLGGIAGSFAVRRSEAPVYQTAVWVSIGSHILMILIVAAFTVYFYIANRRQSRGKAILEGVPGFRYTY
ncbi:hypothetical protein VTN02DRAFT_2446 [Thermoascus thermophilus]